jgi:hypothetical protein
MSNLWLKVQQLYCESKERKYESLARKAETEASRCESLVKDYQHDARTYQDLEASRPNVSISPFVIPMGQFVDSSNSWASYYQRRADYSKEEMSKFRELSRGYAACACEAREKLGSSK